MCVDDGTEDNWSGRLCELLACLVGIRNVRQLRPVFRQLYNKKHIIPDAPRFHLGRKGHGGQHS